MQNDTCYILALIKRDDGERLLLGSGFYQFNKEQKHFNPNVFANDIVELQGADGQLLAGQVRRSSAQSFDGYIGDGTTSKQTVEQKRREFFLFFRKQHHYTVVYIMPDGTAIKRDRGYIVDAPAVQELYQVQPKWHIALAFEDVNYYSYAEDAQGNEIYSFTQTLGLANITDGGLIWDNDGAISEAQMQFFIGLKGDTYQNGTPTPTSPVPVQIVTGEQTITVNGTNYPVTLKSKNLFDKDHPNLIDGQVTYQKTLDTSAGKTVWIRCEPDTTYTCTKGLSQRSRAGTAKHPLVGANLLTNYVAESTLLPDGRYKCTITSGPEDTYLYYTFDDSSDWEGVLMAIQIEEGSTPTDFVNFVDMNFRKLGTHQDRIYRDGDDWKIEKQTGNATKDVEVAGIKLDKTSGSTAVSEAGAFAIFNSSFSEIATARASENIGTYKQDASVTGNAGANAMTDGTFCQRQGTNDRCYFRNTAYIGKTGNEMRALLLANSYGANVCHYLSTPTTTTITDATLIAQLNAVKAAIDEYGSATVSATSPNLPAILGLTPNMDTGGYVWAPSTGGGPVTVTVDGVDSANPVWHVFGACTNPTLTNSTTGQALTWNGDVPAGQELIIDMGAQTATLEGANVFEFVSGSWIQLAPGTNRISYTAANTTQDSKIEWNEIVG